jgi:hypothetical protein
VSKPDGAAIPFARKGILWDAPTMTIKADSKKRVVVPDARPGDVFAYEDHGNGHFHLVRLTAPDKPKKMTRAQVGKALDACRLKFDLTWDEMRKMTREP